MKFQDFAENRNFTEDQASAIEYLQGPLLVCAGAGSGKTYTLTQRIAWALLPGSGEAGKPFLNSVDEALVITFTEKAAGEIKERVRSTLRAEGMLEEALKVDSAWISTIHGMCSRILREHALEVGLDPAFTVIGATQEEELLSAAIEAVLARTSEEGSAFELLFDQFRAEHIRESLEQLLKTIHTLPAGFEAINLGPEGNFKALVRAAIDNIENPTEAKADKYYDWAGPALENLNKALNDDLSPNELGVTINAIGLSGTGLTDEIKDPIKTLKAEVAAAPFRACAEELIELARQVEDEYQRFLYETGQIDISGLIRKTLAVFEESPDIAAQYTNRFKLVMVDEFQDTSQLQIEMIERITGKNRSQLCTVGDAQQSIYRFQGADVSVYMQHKQDMLQAGAKFVQLQENFRSHNDVLAFVRAVCGQESYFQEDFLDLQATTEGAEYKSKQPRIELALSITRRKTKEKPSINVAAAHPSLEKYIAQRFKQLANDGHVYSDMVLLLGRMTYAREYARAMHELGLPCVVTGGSKYYDGAHVQTCLSLLQVLANPYDAASLLTVFTSEALPVSADDLLFLSTTISEQTQMPVRQGLAKGLLYKKLAPENPSDLLVHAQAVLERAWEKLGKVRPAQLFLETVIDAGWLARLEAGGPTEQAQAADILKFVRLVEDAQEELGFDMARVANEMYARSVSSSEKPGALSVENLDAIRIMTIHSAKGLEFPIAAVADCFEVGSGGGRSQKLVTLVEDGVLYTSLSSDGASKAYPQLPDKAALCTEPGELRSSIMAINKNKDYEERKRLFYVAATRPKTALIVGMCVSHTTAGYSFVADDILRGLFPGQTDFPEGETSVDFGGSAPLRFVRLAPEEIEEDQVEAHPSKISVPVLEDVAPLSFELLSARDGFFSYSSLAHAAADEAAGGSGTASGADAAGDGSAAPGSAGAAGDASAAPGSTDAQTTTQATPALEKPHPPQGGMSAEEQQFNLGEEELPVPPAPAADVDKATDFGSALHRACEWLALQAAEPSAAEIDHALARAAQEFGVQDTDRLRAAFECWQGSDARRWANSFETQQPELPFAVEKDGRILEGEIDLFCATGSKAGIIDYKTGGSVQESEADLHAKHLLQAQCYAYAALQAGYDEVELRFVRVEQQDPAQSGQPQVVKYSFTRDDLSSW